MSAQSIFVLSLVAFVLFRFVVQLIKDGLLRFPNPKKRAFYEARHKEHEAGWFVVLDGERISILDYLCDSQPFHVFRFTALTQDQSKISFALQKTAWREPCDRVVFQIRVYEVRLAEKSFIASLHKEQVSIRDWRHWNVKQNDLELIRK
jgi:hypothetical protein